ncbi:hypothetical protein WAI453_001952 [Rhynchosporium graminicola]
MISRFAIASAVLAVLAGLVQAGQVIQVSPQTKYQKYDGTGISQAFKRSALIHNLSPEYSKLALDFLFSNTTGAGLTILRNGIGSSPTDDKDFMYSIAVNVPASNSSEIDYVPFLREDNYQVWLSTEAIARGVHTIYADAWSADGYMKTTGIDNKGGNLCGVTGTNCATGDWRQSYANKLVRYINNYKSHGITIDYVGFLNEPDLNTSYASMQSTGQQAADFLKIFYPTLKKSGLKTEIACCDGSGWEEQRSRLTGIQKAGQEDTLGLVTSHGYATAPGAPFKTDKKVWMTEWMANNNMTYDWYRSGDKGEGLHWAINIQNTFTVSNASAFLYWWGASGSKVNTPLIFINNTDTVRVTPRLWAHAHFGSRFIRKGATRIGATSNISTLKVSAFANTDGTTAIQVINNGLTNETVTLQGITSNKVLTYLTNQAHNLTEGSAALEGLNAGGASAVVPGKSLLTFYIT